MRTEWIRTKYGRKILLWRLAETKTQFLSVIYISKFWGRKGLKQKQMDPVGKWWELRQNTEGKVNTHVSTAKPNRE